MTLVQQSSPIVQSTDLTQRWPE